MHLSLSTSTQIIISLRFQESLIGFRTTITMERDQRGIYLKGEYIIFKPYCIDRKQCPELI
jgi:hypothetical protein